MVFARIFIFLLLLYAAPFANAQNSRSTTIKLLCQNWKIKELNVVATDAEAKEDLEDLIKYARIEFKADMTLIDKTDEFAEEGKWELNKAGDEVTIIFKEGDKIRLKILSLSSLLFKFKSLDEGSFPSGTLVPAKN